MKEKKMKHFSSLFFLIIFIVQFSVAEMMIGKDLPNGKQNPHKSTESQSQLLLESSALPDNNSIKKNFN
jgi:hypothetical protein